jgi:hypothetical protein
LAVPSNFFDQADQAPVAAPSGNFFDQADAAPAPQQAPQQAPHQFGLMDTWPARLAKAIYSGVTLPGDVLAGKASVPQSANMPGGESTENIGRVVDLASLASPGAPKAGATIARPAAVPRVPTLPQLETAENVGFTGARAAGNELAPNVWPKLGEQIENDLLVKHGIDATSASAPRTLGVLQGLQRVPADSTITMANVHSLRKAFGNIANDAARGGADTEALAARTARGTLDRYLEAIPPRDIVAGDPQQAANVLREAIANSAAKFRSQRIQDIGTGAQANVEATNTFGQLGRNIRQGTKQFLKGDTSGFSPEEIAQAERVRRAGRLVGTAGSVLGGIAPAVLSGGTSLGASAILKYLESMAAKRALGKLDEMVRARSPLGQQMAGQPAAYQPNAMLTYALRQGLLPAASATLPPFFAQPAQTSQPAQQR